MKFFFRLLLVIKLGIRQRTSDGGPRMYFILLLILNICFCPAFIFAQSTIKIEGYIYDRDDGHPITGAIVEIPNTNYGCRTDNSGYFFLEKIPTGTYSLRVSSPGYESQMLSSVKVSEDITTKIDVQLNKKTFFLSGLEITAEKEPIKIVSTETIDRTRIEKMQAKSLGEIIESISGVYVQNSGGAGGVAQVSIRGSLPEHVLVLLDGHKINPSGSGIADLNTIPLEMIEKVEIYKGGQSAQYGADALGGVINVITRPLKVQEPFKLNVESQWGKWDTEAYSTSFSNTFFKKLQIKFAGSYQYSKNDFEIWVYDDPKKREILKSQGQNGDSTTTRKNAYKRASNLFMSGSYLFNRKTELGFSGQLYRSENGLPGSYGWMVNYQRARAEDERRFLCLKLTNLFSSNFSLENDFSWSRFNQHFQNDTITPFNSKYADNVVDFSSLAHIKIFPTNQLKIGTEFQEDVLRHTDLLNSASNMGRIKRQSFSIFFSDEQQFNLLKILFFKKLTANLAMRWDHSKTLKDFLSPQVGLTLTRGEEYRLSVRSNYGKSYHQPSNNALFWKEDVFAEGNPDLLPEKSEHSEAGGEVHLPWLGELSGGVTYFRNFVTNLIEWHRRFDGKYHPVNVSRAKIYGHEDFISWKSPENILEINYNNTVCIAKNKSGDRIYDGKFIPFRPRYVTNLNFGLDYRIFDVSYKLRWVSERFTGPANSIAQREAPYHLQDLSVGLKKKLWGVQAKLRCEWTNLTDQEYRLIYRHPMPGRGWGVNLEMGWEL